MRVSVIPSATIIVFATDALCFSRSESAQAVLSALGGHGFSQQIPMVHESAETSAARYWLDEQDHTGNARGYAPFLGNDHTYPVYRNVRSYGALGDGKKDDSDALQNAINTDGKGGTRYKNEVTTRPAEVFVPGGVYRISRTIDLRLNTILVGDPNNRPVFKATSNFSGRSLINGYDFATDGSGGTTNFFVAVKNIIVDTNDINKDKTVVGLNWGVAQACQLTNIRIQMPSNSGGHVGIALDQGSTTSISDTTIVGGAIGIRNSNQQLLFKTVSFQFCTTAIAFLGGFTAVVQNARFDTCGLGVDATGAKELGSVIILDCTSVNSGPVIRFRDESHANGPRNNQIVIENLHHSGPNAVAVAADYSLRLQRIDLSDTWIWGNVDPGTFQAGKIIKTARSGALLANGKFFTKAQPTYKELKKDEVVNVKAVQTHPVKGDGSNDDSASLNAILAENAARGKISYFPYGVYILKHTLHVPPGSRIVGEAWPVLSGIGSTFGDRNNPRPVVMVGNPGERGTVEIQDMRFTVADISPGAIVLQVHLAGSAPGEVGMWNSHITVGGTADTNVNNACSNADTADCLAAFALLHLASTSSCYIENMWGWTADHSLERGRGPQNIATGRGALVEATRATWLAGTAFEHNTLYNYNLHGAANVYAGLQQSETAYWQGIGGPHAAPAPWVPLARYGDPDFTWCGATDLRCRMGLALHVDGGGRALYLYGAAFWTFFHGETSGCYNCAATVCGPTCIQHQTRVAIRPPSPPPSSFYWFGVNTRNSETMVLDGRGNPSQFNHPGGWTPGGVIAGYVGF